MPYFLCKFWQSTIWSSHAFVVRILPISHIPKPVFYFWSHMILSSLYPVLHLFPLLPLPLSSFQCFILVENFHWLQIVFRGYNQERLKRIIRSFYHSIHFKIPWSFSSGRAALSFFLSGLLIFCWANIWKLSVSELVKASYLVISVLAANRAYIAFLGLSWLLLLFLSLSFFIYL